MYLFVYCLSYPQNANLLRPEALFLFTALLLVSSVPVSQVHSMNFRYHVTDLPHFANEAPAGQLRELRALPKVTGLGPQGGLTLPSPLLPGPREGD